MGQLDGDLNPLGKADVPCTDFRSGNVRVNSEGLDSWNVT